MNSQQQPQRIRPLKKLLLIVLAAVLSIVLGLVAVVLTKRPAQRAPTFEKVVATPELIARGNYLVEHVLVCGACHAERDWARFAGPPREDHHLAGGACWGEEYGFPGTICMPNISPDAETGLGAWTDGEVARAVREGVDREGKALFPLMPYETYRSLSDNDMRAVLAYLRSTEAVAKRAPETNVKFPVSFFIKMLPKPLEKPVEPVSSASEVELGKYLVTVGNCLFCHTAVDKHKRSVKGRDFAGGNEFVGPWGKVVSANITPHETGLGGRSREQFIAQFKSFSDEAQVAVPVEPHQNTVMPWLLYAGLTEKDLGAIYAYLQTVPPIENRVVVRPAN